MFFSNATCCREFNRARDWARISAETVNAARFGNSAVAVVRRCLLAVVVTKSPGSYPTCSVAALSGASAGGYASSTPVRSVNST